MNKSNIIGLTLIGLIFVGFAVYNTNVSAREAARKRVQDSIATANAIREAERQAFERGDSIIAALEGGKSENVQTPSKGQASYANEFIANAANLQEEFFTLENNNLKILFSSKGAQPVSVQVKGYYTSDSTDLMLIKQGLSNFSMNIYESQYLSTEKLVYSLSEKSDSTLALRLYFTPEAYIENRYTLKKDSYLLNFEVNMHGMDKVLPRNVSSFDFNWTVDIPRLEKGFDNEKSYSTIVYKFPGDNSIDNLGLRKSSAHKKVTTRMEWFAFQQQFFSAIFRAENSFEGADLDFKFFDASDSQKRLFRCHSSATVAFPAQSDVSIPFEFYFGPNHYKTLNSLGYGFERIVPMGKLLVGWINRFVIIPIFNLFNNSIASYGIIILLLTLIIKLVLSPLTLKSYMSSAKMNVLRPEIEKINAKYPKPEDAMKKQQATMDLYKKAGVSMFGGCLPMLLQFPILWAMFRFFPTAFELRQQSFLWADDLSTYDSILNFGFNIPLLGNHISLFSLLCAVTMFFSAKLTQGQQMDSNPQAKSMKFMTLYFMPVFMFFICNNLSSGLTYYYLLSNLIMIIQTMVIRKFFVDEKKIMEKIRLASQKAENKPKSKFQQRLEAIQKAQQEALREQQKNQRR